jgi:hypothetical protein
MTADANELLEKAARELAVFGDDDPDDVIVNNDGGPMAAWKIYEEPARAVLRLALEEAARMAAKYADQNNAQSIKLAKRMAKLRSLGMDAQAESAEIGHSECAAAMAEASAIEHAILSLIPGDEA